MTANGVAAWKDLDGDGIATATLNSSGGSPDANSVTTGTIVDGAIIDADINAAAAIAVSKLAAGTATYVLTSTSGTAVWSAPASGAPSGAAGGSLTGTYPNPTIASIPSGATATTQTAADGSTKVATTAYVDTADALKANLASPTFTGHPVGVTEAALNNSTRLASTAYADAAVAVENSRATTAEGLLAPLASPTFTGTPSLPTGTTGTTQSAADSSTKVATTAFVTTADNLKANLAGPTFTGTVTLPSTTVAVTQSASDNSTKPATTAYADTADALKANIASPTFTGTPAAPTAAGTTSTTQLATTAMVQAAIAAQVGVVGGLPKIVIRTGDSNTISANATPGNDDTLLWAVGANDRWFFQAFLTFTAAAGSGTSATEDVKLGWSVPASGAMQWGAGGITTNSLGGYGGVTTANAPIVLLNAAGTLSEGMATGSIGVSLAGFYTGGGSSGNVNLQWSQDVSNGATLLIAKNSMIIAWRIA